MMPAVTHTIALPVGQRRSRPFGRLMVTELKLLLREPLALFWGTVFPLILLIVIGVPTHKHHQRSLGGLTFIDVYVPVLCVFVLAILALNAVPATLASYRDKGYLRRLSTTPMGARRLLAAQLLINLGIAACAVAVILIVGAAAFGVSLPAQVAGFLIAIVLGAIAMLALGTLVGALAPNQRAANLFGSLLFFPMMFFAGLWVPRAQMGAVLRHISDYTPLGATVAGVQRATADNWPHPMQLLVLVVWAAVLCLAAVRFFRWDR
jgi:ABC-2 type transport system permease protein